MLASVRNPTDWDVGTIDGAGVSGAGKVKIPKATSAIWRCISH